VVDGNAGGDAGQAVKRRQVFGERATQYQSDTSDLVAERERFELANGVRPLRHFQCGLPRLPNFEGHVGSNFNSI